MKKFICLLVTLLLGAASFTSVYAIDESGIPIKDRYSQLDSDKVIYKEVHIPFYSEIYADYLKKGYQPATGPDIVVDLGEVASENSSARVVSSLGGKTGEFVYLKNEKWVEWKVDVAAAGLYNLKIGYFMEKGTGEGIPTVRALKIDGESPFFETDTVTFYRHFKDVGKTKINNLGDEIRPSQEEIESFNSTLLYDSQGFNQYPMEFYFEPGKHTIRFEYIDRSVYITELALTAPKKTATYSDYLESHEGTGAVTLDQPITVQAESSVIRKNDATIRRESNGDPACEPASVGVRRLNVFGAYSWNKGGQAVTWQIPVEQDGFYQIGLRFAAAWNDGLPVYRQIMVDGVVPFDEFSAYEFAYNRRWQNGFISDKDGNPYLVYLTKGQHELTMRVVMGPLTEAIQGLFYDTIELSEIIRSIIMITTNEPDPNYEYFLEKKIPDLIPRLHYLRESIMVKYDRINSLAVKRPAVANRLNLFIRQLSEMAARPYSISRRLKDLKDAQTAVGLLYESLQISPIMFDYFRLNGEDSAIAMKKANVFEMFYAIVKTFLVSYTKDYDNISGKIVGGEDYKTLNVWVSQGQEWAELIKEMADEQFMPTQNVYLNINLLPQSQLNVGSVNALMLSIASNKQPDAALGIANNSPVELAIRDAVYDLSSFPDFETVKAQFIPEMMIPFGYLGGTYGIPETMNFRVLIYRKDIFQEMGLSLPDTWDDIYNKLVPALSQNNMKFYVPLDYGMFLFQLGGQYYRNGGLLSALDSKEAYKAFKEWTELYTNYNIPIVADFYNRMRIGEIPAGIGTFEDYIKLTVAAPELNGKWGIAPVPGHLNADKTVNRSITGTVGNSDIILNRTQMPDEAWALLKWWSSAKVQTQFGQEIEALMGKEARWNTANIEAFTSLPWKMDDLAVIRSCWNDIKETPVVLGGYMTGRHVMNAWNRVVLTSEDVPRNALDEAVEIINRELVAKQEEYGIKAVK